MIDTVLLLRPTESAVVFLQQLGRGLRLSPETGKSCLTVLDFIGQQHHRFRFDQRFRALLGGGLSARNSRRQLESQLDQGFPFLPPGCRLVLDRVSQQAVLASLRASFPTRRPALLGELRALAYEGLIGAGSGLADWLEALAMEPADFYGVRGAGFTSLRRELGWLPGDPHPQEESLTRAIGAGLLHLDDPDRLRATTAALAAPSPPDPERLGERERRQWLMLTAQLCGTGKRWRPLPEALALLWQASAWRDELRQLLDLLAERAERRLHPLPWALPVPLCVHGRYSRAEIEAAFGILNDDAPWIHREGVLWHEPSHTDLLFVTLNKSEALFSPSTRTRDLALGPNLFHWESQEGEGGAGNIGGVDAGDGVGGLASSGTLTAHVRPGAPMRLAELQQLAPQLHELLARHGASNPAVFGSVARDQALPGSDVDLLVDLPAGASLFDRAELKSALEELLLTRVDLIRRRNLKPELKAKVAAEAIPL